MQFVFADFKNHLKIPKNVILRKKYEEKKIKIVVYCLEKDILINHEYTFLNFSYRKHRSFWMRYHPFEVTKIIPVNKNQSSTYEFTSRRY